MPEVFRGHEFEALKCRFENQTEQLHRMTLTDLRVFSGYITLQGAQLGIAQSYLTFRNRALHAKWAKVDRAAAQSVLSFTEQVVASQFA